MKTTIVYAEDDLARLVAEINAAQWDSANDLSVYDEPSLRAYLEREDTCLVCCHSGDSRDRTLLGFASARIEHKPYDREKWLYVDEVDVCVDQRQRGAGTALMKTLLKLADDAGCTEVWLGTETDNVAANALYRSLSPTEVETFVGYNFERDP